jgi:hypothetical protein
MINDLVRRRLAIERAKAALGSGTSDVSLVAPDVWASWARCAPHLSAGEREAAPVGSPDDARARWQASPVRRAAAGVVDQLEQVATTGGLIACIADADGRVLWQSTPRHLRAGAERIGLIPGGVWHEQASGTNGIGLTLAVDRPAVVFATEHWLSPVYDWVCYAAPVHGCDGTQVAAVNLSTTWKDANPLALATASSLARLIEHELRLLEPTDASTRTPALDLRLLGSPAAVLDGQAVHLTQRQFEILTVLSVHGTVSLGELHALLYGDRPVARATLKAEMSRLRRLLGGRLTSRPYRLTLTGRVDAVRLLERLDRGDVEGAARLYAGQLLPDSEAPFVAEHRQHLDVALRTALVHRGTSAAALRYGAVHPYDVEVLERARALAASDDPLVPALTARLAVATAG